MANLTVLTQYESYLEKVGMKEELMHPEQKIQVKDAFFAGYRMCLVYLTGTIVDLPADEGIVHIEENLEETRQFFINRAKQG